MGRQEGFLERFIKNLRVYSLVSETCSDKSTQMAIFNFIKNKELKIDLGKHPDANQIISSYEEVLSRRGKFVLNFISPSGEEVKMMYVNECPSSALEPATFFISPDEITRFSRAGDRDASGIVGTRVSTLLTSENGKVYRASLENLYKYTSMYGQKIMELPSKIKMSELSEDALDLAEETSKELGRKIYIWENTVGNEIKSIIELFDAKLENSFVEIVPVVDSVLPPTTTQELDSFVYDYSNVERSIAEYNKMLIEASQRTVSESV